MVEEKKDTPNLFYPWFFGGELKGQIENYISDKENHLNPFKSELINLYNEFTKTPEEKTIYILNIGANCSDDDLPSWHRELPDFILGGIRADADVKIKLLLVDNFKDDYIPKTVVRDREFAVQTETGWLVRDYNLEIKLFKTFFPSYYETKKAYRPASKQYKTIEKKRKASDDENFVLQFYSQLQQFISETCSVGSLFITLSTASFKYSHVTESIPYEGKQGQDGYGNRTLELYPELINIIQDSNSNCFYLFVWPFESEHFYLFGSRYRIKYMDQDALQFNFKNGKLILTPIRKNMQTNFKNSQKTLFSFLQDERYIG